MMHTSRPTHIETILQTIYAGDDTAISAELETYIDGLETKPLGRPVRIATILRTIGGQYPVDMATVLEAYISYLETKQQAVPPANMSSTYDPNNPPVWSHQREMERQQRRRERALKRLNGYQ